MLFNSITFAIYLILVFAAWWGYFAKAPVKLRSFFLLAVSYLFYGWWDWRFLSLIFISSVADYFAALGMTGTTELKKRKAWMALSLVVNLGMLGFFKYYDFFAESLAAAFHSVGIHLDSFTLGIVVPVGVSFYTFQTLSYTIDAYRGRIQPTRDFITFLSFVSFFPQLVAGPIERAADLMPQFFSPKVFSYPYAVQGLRLILWGIFKKVVIADLLAPYVEVVHKTPGDYTGLDAALAMVFFTLQAYCDFSGYSDIAVGTGRLFGFRLSPNFRTPLLSSSMQNIWQRWHMTLMSWFRDYVYIPLGGNRVKAWRWYFNLILIFVISGLWHGAEWTFVIWGFGVGVWMCIEAFTRMYREPRQTAWKVVAIVKTFLVFAFLLILFRADSMESAGKIFAELFTGNWAESHLLTQYNSELDLFMSNAAEALYLGLLIVFLFTMDGWIGSERDFSDIMDTAPRAVRYVFYYGLIAWLLLLGAYGVPQPFIYFQF